MSCCPRGLRAADGFIPWLNENSVFSHLAELAAKPSEEGRLRYAWVARRFQYWPFGWIFHKLNFFYYIDGKSSKNIKFRHRSTELLSLFKAQLLFLRPVRRTWFILFSTEYIAIGMKHYLPLSCLIIPFFDFMRLYGLYFLVWVSQLLLLFILILSLAC